ncbi:MAG TPA: efflux RND transporter periplasmic adaptor subunit [Candidatus Didemnitutus sp.]|nr:efflux RND transporter periplasmic adaptor subunit [Candidatus Didemnitutus sp.]
MKSKYLVAAGVTIIAAAIFYWIHRSRANEADADEENVPTEVAVDVGEIQRATLHGYVFGFGTVAPAPASGSESAATSRVAPPSAGVVREVLVTEGAQVEKGSVLVVLDDRAAQIAVHSAQQVADRQKTLFEENNSSRKSLEDAEAQLATAQAQLDLLHVRAPISGTVTRLAARVGEAVDLTAPLAEITDLSRMVVTAEIPSGDASRVKMGSPLEIVGGPTEVIHVTFISPVVDPATDTFTVRAAMPPGSHLSAGSMVRIRITAEEHADCLAAPAAGVVTNSEGETVIAVVNGDQAIQQTVKTGLREGGLIEVTGDALVPGTKLVTTGAYGLPAKTKIRVNRAGTSEAGKSE